MEDMEVQIQTDTETYFLYCSARDWDGSGLLGGIPRVLVQISDLTLKGPL